MAAHNCRRISFERRVCSTVQCNTASSLPSCSPFIDSTRSTGEMRRSTAESALASDSPRSIRLTRCCSARRVLPDGVSSANACKAGAIGNCARVAVSSCCNTGSTSAPCSRFDGRSGSTGDMMEMILEKKERRIRCRESIRVRDNSRHSFISPVHNARSGMKNSRL